MADIKIDEGKAMDWIKEVQGEIISVEKTLKSVEQVCAEFPGDSDDLIKWIEKTGKFIEESWTTANSTFKDAWNALEEGLSIFKGAGEKIQNAFDDLKTRI